MKINKSKKAVEMTLNTIIIAAILLIVMVIVIVMFSRLFGQEAGQIEDQISSLGDEDNDGIVFEIIAVCSFYCKLHYQHEKHSELCS